MTTMTRPFAACFLFIATPVCAQYFPPPPNWGFGYENFEQVRFLTIRLNRIQARLHQVDRRHHLTGRSGDRMIEEANAIQRHLRNDAAYGLTPHDADVMAGRVIRLERKVAAAFTESERRLKDPNLYADDDWRRDADQDHDKNGRDDRWEDDFRVDSVAGPPR